MGSKSGVTSFISTYLRPDFLFYSILYSKVRLFTNTKPRTLPRPGVLGKTPISVITNTCSCAIRVYFTVKHISIYRYQVAKRECICTAVLLKVVTCSMFRPIHEIFIGPSQNNSYLLAYFITSNLSLSLISTWTHDSLQIINNLDRYMSCEYMTPTLVCKAVFKRVNTIILLYTSIHDSLTKLLSHINVINLQKEEYFQAITRRIHCSGEDRDCVREMSLCFTGNWG